MVCSSQEVALKSTYYNQTTVQCQQTAEKFLKHLITTYCTEAPVEQVKECLKTHNMRKLLRFIQDNLSDFSIDTKKVIGLQGYYYETRYPGDNFFTATEEDVEICYEAIKEVKRAVDAFIEQRSRSEIK